jgi:RNA polymerase sigma-70 factor (ECF subfamily)
VATVEIAQGEADWDWAGLEDVRQEVLGFLYRRLRDKAEVEDLLHETLMRAARYRSALRDREKLCGWVLRIASNVLTDHFRRERRIPCTGLDDGFEPPERDAEGLEREDPYAELRCGNWLVEKGQALDYLDGAFRGLGPEDRRVLDSFYRGAGSCRETARECEIPVDLVKVRLFRARKRLQRALQKRISLGLGRSVLLEST